jgi:hypothetical protein
MARIGANHPHHTLAPHDLALAADFLTEAITFIGAPFTSL